MGFKEIPKADIGRMCELWMNGVSIRRIAIDLGYTEATIGNHLRDDYLGTTSGNTMMMVKQSAMNDDLKAADQPKVKPNINPPRIKNTQPKNYRVFLKNGARKSDY